MREAPARLVGGGVFLRSLVLCLTVLFTSSAAFAQVQVPMTASTSATGGELVLEGAGALAGEIEIISGVAVLPFSEAVATDPRNAARTLRPFVSLARMDEDGLALRIALRHRIDVSREVRGNDLVLMFAEETVTPAATVEASVQPAEQVTPPEPEVPAGPSFEVTERPMFRPDYVAPVMWAVDVTNEPGVAVAHFTGGEAEIEANVSTRVAVLTFPPNNRVNLAGLDVTASPLLEEATADRAENGNYQLTLVGVEGTIASHRREGSTLHVAFRHEMTDEPAEGGERMTLNNGGEVSIAAPSLLAGPEEQGVYTGELNAELVSELDRRPLEVAAPVITVEVLEAPDGAHILFPFEQPTPGAVFRRGNSLWMVFESGSQLDIQGLQGRYRGLFRDPQVLAERDLAVLRLEVPNYVLATTSVDGYSWMITLGEGVMEPTIPLEVVREPNHEHDARVAVDFPGAGSVQSVRDPDIGDEIIVVTGMPPVRGLVTPRSNVDFSMLETAHGLAFERLADNLRVSIAGEQVVITADGGLQLSEQYERQLELEVAAAPHTMPGYMNFQIWGGDMSEGFLEARHEFLQGAATATGAELMIARLNLVRFYLARGFNAEALGVLHLMEAEDPLVLESPAFRAVRGVSLIRMRRFDEGIHDLSVNELQLDESAALWRGLARYEMGDVTAARREFADGARMLTAYRPGEQARFRLAMAKAAWEIGDYAQARDDLDNVPTEGLPDHIEIEAEFVRGLISEGLDERPAALGHYEHVITSGYEPMVVRAMFRRTRLLREMEEITIADAINQLEGLRFRWRGDDLEVQVLEELGRQYVANDQYREGLEIWRLAVTSFPGDNRARQVHDEMQDVFVSLYLEGGADQMSPVRALGLFDEFQDLTPIGRDGDDMVRRLADRLVSVDLLDQAARLLSHQVENRLRGVARAQVATRLAIVYLLDRRPAEALQAVRSTRQTLLPENLNRERRIVEARALAAMDRYDHALEVLANERREEASRLRAEIQWEAGYWEDAATGFEELLGAAWRSERPLDDDQRTDVMRSAIAFAFADDEVGLTRLRTKYSSHMAQSPDAEAFDIVTGRIDTQGLAFREMARRIASVDTLEAFMARMREQFHYEEAVMN